MAKTKPIGVRFDEGMLEDLKLTPQKALNLLTTAYFYDTKKIELFIPNDLKIKNVFIDKKGKITSAVSGKSVTVTLKPENYYHESQNKPHTDTKKENVSESMPEGLNWKERMEWTHNYKQKLKTIKK